MTIRGPFFGSFFGIRLVVILPLMVDRSADEAGQRLLDRKRCLPPYPGDPAMPNHPASLDLVAGTFFSLSVVFQSAVHGIWLLSYFFTRFFRFGGRHLFSLLPASPRHDVVLPDVWHEKPEPKIVAAIVDVAPEGEELNPPRRL